MILALMGWYLFLITIHYVNQRPLWNDELCVFASIKDYSFEQLFTIPLSHVQQFPKVYVFLIQQLSAPFHFSLLSLRFLPFIFMLGAFFVWMRIAAKELRSVPQRICFVLCFAASIPLIYYAAELKQYSMDVFAGSLFILLCMNQLALQQSRPGLYKAILVLMPMLGLFSYTAFLFFIFPLYNIIRSREWKNLNCFLYLMSCVIVLLFVYVYDVRISNGAALREYWQEYMISFQSIPDFLRTFVEGVNNLISRWFAEMPKWVRMAARFFVAFGLWEMCTGFYAQLKKDNYYFISVYSLAFIVFLELVILGSLHLYAFTIPRTSLFFAPVILMLSIKGMERLKTIHPLLFKVILGLFMGYLIMVSLGIAREIVLRGDLGAQSRIFNSK